jgi:hypothetical protein
VPAHDLFFSYRRADLPRAALLHDALTRTGLTIWFDQTHIPGHAPITSEIRHAIAASKALLAFYSRTYPDSRPCQMELLTAWLAAQHLDKDATRRVLIVNPESPDFHHIPPALRDSQSPPFPSDPAGFDELARRIHDHISQIEGSLLSVSADPPRYFGMSPVSARRFVGRAEQFWTLHGSLLATDISIITGQVGQSVAQIVGMPGNGKSLLAQEYAIRFGPAFPGGIFSLNAGADREDQIREFARQLRIPGIDNLELKDVPAAFWNFLNNTGKRCLWIVDDLASELEAWLSKTGHAATLITTRNQSYDWIPGKLHLDVLTSNEAEQLLALHRAPKNDAETEALRAIAGELGWHPLAVEVAGSYIAKGLATFSQYLARLHAPSGPDDILESGAQLQAHLPTGHDRSIFRTFITSIHQLREEGLDFLRLASVLAPSPIPVEFVEQVLGVGRFVSAIDQVDTLSLCERAGDDARAVHTLVSRTMQAFAPQDDAIRGSAVRALLNCLQVVGDIRTHEGLSDFVVHARHLVSARLDDEDDTRLAALVARHDYERGEFRAAGILDEQVVEARRRILGDEHPGTLTAKHNLAGTLRAQGDLAGARKLHEEVLEARQRILGDEHADTITSMSNLAGTLARQGDLASARGLEEQVVEARRRVLGAENRDTLIALGNLASTLASQGDLSSARRLQEQVLEVHRRVLGDEHPDTLTSMNNLAGTLHDQGDLAGARVLQEHALEVRRRVLGTEHPDTLTSMNNLAGTLLDQGDLASARVLQEHVLEARRRVLGTEHPDTLVSTNNLADTLRRQGDLAGARRLQEQVLDASRRVLGTRHPNTMISMNNLAVTVRALGDLPAAQALEDELARLRAPA